MREAQIHKGPSKYLAARNLEAADGRLLEAMIPVAVVAENLVFQATCLMLEIED